MGKYENIVGKIELEIVDPCEEGQKKYWSMRDEECFICGTLGINEDKVKDLIKIANKEIPMETIKIKDVSSQACPVCKHNVNWNYCSNCGQRIKY